jgi:mono/diheme cytochrome c family protein
MDRFCRSRLSMPPGVLFLVVIVFVALTSLDAVAVFAQNQKPASQAGVAPAGNIENGRKAFIQHGCFSCHGYSAEGGPGARLAQNPIPFQGFVQYVRRPRRSMPPYGTQVSDQELADIYAFIKSIPPSPDAKSIPLLNGVGESR